ncbi:MAG: N-acetylneuraminate synthase family protein [Leptolyngbyaceae bacterium]|nr:N-acetylneuraminate synthase family protein [Leptolyngbyaceae bacterium]
MAEIFLRNGKRIGDYFKPYIVAELNTSHFGDLTTAKAMIEGAKVAGCDCVKFQSWSAETLYCESYYKQNPIAKRFVKKFSLDTHQLKELALYSAELGIDFASTPYSLEEARFLVSDCGVPFIKIASMELNNLPYLSQLGKLGVPLVLSTGMGEWDEIIKAVQTIEMTSNANLIILHCTSVYPSSPEIIRLQNIAGLRAEFPRFPIGYSDHSIGTAIPAASVALGASLIEKHFTLDSKRIGMDNQMAMEPEEMTKMVEACHAVYRAMGGVSRLLSVEERAQVFQMRRSMVSARPLSAGDVLTEDCIEFKRPGTGISPSDYHKFIGRRICRNVDVGTPLSEMDFF